MGNQKSKQFPRWNPEHTFVRVELEVDLAKVLEDGVQVMNERVLVPGFDHNVVNVGLHVAAELTPEAGLHGTLEGSAGVPEAEWHPGVAVAAFVQDECRLLLILLRHQDLMVPG